MTSENIKDMSFEQAMRELENIVRKLESGQGELETAINDYELGNALKEHCQSMLAQAKMKVEKIISQPDGKITTTEFDNSN